jgi:hypothetical protein
VLIIGLIVVSALVAILRFRVTQNLVNIVFALYGLAILAMFVSGIVYLAKGNSAGSITVLGATITYGTWFWWIGGITLASLAVAALLYLVGRMSGNGAAPLPAGTGRHRAGGADG